MPDMPPTLGPSRAIRDREHDARRRKTVTYRGWYNLAIWTKRIRPTQLAKHPLCRMCQDMGLTVPATVVNHVGGHGGDWSKFVNGPFESLCKTHHDSVVQAEERKARDG